LAYGSQVDKDCPVLKAGRIVLPPPFFATQNRLSDGQLLSGRSSCVQHGFRACLQGPRYVPKSLDLMVTKVLYILEILALFSSRSPRKCAPSSPCWPFFPLLAESRPTYRKSRSFWSLLYVASTMTQTGHHSQDPATPLPWSFSSFSPPSRTL